MTMTEREALIALNLSLGANLAQIKAWRESLGSYRAIVEADSETLHRYRISSKTNAVEAAENLKKSKWEDELLRAEKDEVEILTITDDAYPELLRQIHLAPLALYCRGNIECLNQCLVAMIGSRNASSYGIDSAKKLAANLAEAGVGVVSGLATGIDAAAHCGALDGGGTTIGVLGGALNCFYPKENIALAKRMVENDGLVISEFPFNYEPTKFTFPRRNRIISGLCRCVVAIETPASSGTMITVNHAEQQNRTIMAVPGRIDSFRSEGCNRLIRDGAGVVTCAKDILDELGEFIPRAPAGKQREQNAKRSDVQRVASLSDEEKLIWDVLSDEPLYPETIIERTGLEAGKLGALLIGLQMRNLARPLPGGAIERIN